MLADFVVYLLVSYFELGKVSAAHRADWFLGLILVSGCEPLDTSYAKRVLAIGDNAIGGGDGIKAERTIASWRVIIYGDDVLYQCNFLEIRRCSFYNWGG